jgi:hypothetical protein
MRETGLTGCMQCNADRSRGIGGGGRRSGGSTGTTACNDADKPDATDDIYWCADSLFNGGKTW